MGSTEQELLYICYKYFIAYSLVFFKVALVLVNNCFVYYVYEVRNLHETRIYTINIILKKNQLFIN